VRGTVDVDVPPLAEPVSDDPDDDKFLAAAVASETPLIVSGDGALLRVAGWRGIDVLTPRQFVERHLASND
jgi:predicted nucleic acid-binding protein